MDPHHIVDGLDDDQRRAATNPDRVLSIIAGPGTGKTRTLAHRIAFLAASGDLDPHATMALSFTNQAADELGARLATMGASAAQSRTIHSAALRQANYFWPIVYGAPLPQVVKNNAPLVLDACKRVGVGVDDVTIHRIGREISWTKQSNVVPEHYALLATTEDRRVPYVDAGRVAEVIAAYEEAKQAECVIDMDDLLLCDVALLDTQPTVAARVRQTYRHLFIDEAQDLSPVQARLIDLWRGPNSTVTVVGDPAQAIYSFAGANPSYLRDYAAQRSGSQLQLSLNYRSRSEIVAIANRLGGEVILQPTLGPGGRVQVVAYDDAAEECGGVAAWLQEAAKGMAWEDMAVLTRTRREAIDTAKVLTALGVSVCLEVDADAPAGHGVHVGTLHASKGREYEAVCILGVHEGNVPHGLATRQTVAEEKRLMYVGLTRAKSALRLSWSRFDRGRIVGRSRFLSVMGL